MTDYAVGDIQGCLTPLKALLEALSFDPANDCLYSVGDIVNRGPHSLETLRFCYQLGDSFRMVLGNHDLHLLAVAHHIKAPNRKDTLDDILQAPDRDELLQWLQHQPLLRKAGEYTIVHAGIPPQWELQQAFELAAEVEHTLHSTDALAYFQAMYGNLPDTWSNSLAGTNRLRVITNYLTRMRFCSPEGKLELSTKSGPLTNPPGFAPWFTPSERKTRDNKIIFGHWAALEGAHCGVNLYPLDTGCVWGGPLRIMNLETGEYLHHHQN